MTFLAITISCNSLSLESGTSTTPTFGSIVQKGKFSAGIEDWVMALNNVDLPTFGKPMIPHLKL